MSIITLGKIIKREINKKNKKLILRNKIYNIISKNQEIKKTWLLKKQKRDIASYWSRYSPINNFNWHRAYLSINKNDRYVTYIPEDKFYLEIEPKLNNKDLAKAYSDKNFYHKLFPKEIMPRIFLRNIHGEFYDENYEVIKNIRFDSLFNGYERQSFIIKPSLDTSKGKNVKKITFKDGVYYCDEEKYSALYDIIKPYNKDYLIQELIEQNETLSQIYPYSLNTIRIVTLRDKNEICYISAVIRFGNDKRIVDNRGIACGINEDGIINSYGTFLTMEKCFKHPFTNMEFAGVKIPRFHELIEFVKCLHKKLMYFNMVSWDIGIDKNNNFKMIEFNVRAQEINFHQINNGPLFGIYTEEVLNHVYSQGS